MDFASELVGAAIGSQFGSGVPNCRCSIAAMPAHRPPAATPGQAAVAADCLPASGALNGALKSFEAGRARVLFQSRRAGKTARQIAPHGPIYRGPTRLELEPLKTPVKA